MTLSESTLSVPFDTGKAVPEHPSGGGPRVWLDSSCCLVWGECKPDVCSVSSVGARSPALLYFWLPRESGYFQHWHKILCQGLGALAHSPVFGAL